MEERLRKYVEALFAEAPKTKKAIELRQEIYTNLLDKYKDLKNSGASDEEAYEIVKNSIGNVDELIQSLDERPPEKREEKEQARKKAAMLNAFAISLYIASPIFIIAFSAIGLWLPGLILLLSCIAAATGLIVYSKYLNTSFKGEDATLVEEFKEWKADNEDRAKQKSAYSGVLWLIITALYFIISFTTMAWHITWVIFIIGAAVEQIIKINLYK